MTIRELIAELEQYDPETPVVRAVVHNGQVEQFVPYGGPSIDEGVFVEGILGRRYYRRPISQNAKSVDLLVL